MPWVKYAVLGAGVVGAALAVFGRRLVPVLVLAFGGVAWVGQWGLCGVDGALGGASSAAAEIQSWVESTYTATTVGGTTVYTLVG
ncbi:hypothetical protein ACIBL3_34810 [Kribbella sp. NPDC050124]|uniref:hypothetical protein n=1 Tax=Kribbella sp. NPDC050124 TaxID=3364114 RepID=UPI00379529B9